jgi:hypothetical protein
MKRVITELLPAVSKPDDTVFIFFSGHGASFEDPQSPGGRLSYLVPADVVKAETVLAMRILQEADKLTDQGKAQLAKLEGWLAEQNLRLDFDLRKLESMSKEELAAAVKAIEAANKHFVRKTCVTDEEFAHWLQALPGRRVVVIFDACHSAGFGADFGAASPALKKLDLPAPKRHPFEFLMPKLARLKGLGRLDVAFMAAAQAEQSSIAGRFVDAKSPSPVSRLYAEVYRELREQLGEKTLPAEPRKDFELSGLFTGCLVNALLRSTGGLDVDTAGTRCAAEMKDYFGSEFFAKRLEAENAQRETKSTVNDLRHEPYWFDYAQPKVLLKR